MQTLAITLDSDLASSINEIAVSENKPVEAWIAEKLKQIADDKKIFDAMGANADRLISEATKFYGARKETFVTLSDAMGVIYGTY